MSQDLSTPTSDRGRSLGLTQTEYYRLLSDERRRTALAVLETEGTPIDLTELARAVATRADDIDASESEQVEQLATALHHTHLPKMDKLGIVDYDPSTRHITFVE